MGSNKSKPVERPVEETLFDSSLGTFRNAGCVIITPIDVESQRLKRDCWLEIIQKFASPDQYLQVRQHIEQEDGAQFGEVLQNIFKEKPELIEIILAAKLSGYL